MAEFIVNPRRAPRAPARCQAAVLSAEGWFQAETEDIGSMGCQLVSPRLVRRGELVQLQITNPKLAEPLKVSGRVAWMSAQAPWRLGIAFEEEAEAAAGRWFELLVSAYPGLGGYRRVPDRIRADSTVYLAQPPRFLLDFSADEALLLRAIASGTRIDELMAHLRDRWPAAQRALFSLIARQVVTFQRGHAVHPESWKKVLSEVEASLAIEELGKESPALVSAPRAPPLEPAREARPTLQADPVRPVVHAAPLPGAGPAPASRGAMRAAETSWGVPVHDPSPQFELPRDDGSEPLDLATPGSAAPSRVAAPRAAPPRPATPAVAPPRVQGSTGPAGAGAGWRAPSDRSPEAQALFDRALEEIRGGSVGGALSLLRRAMALAPGDPEIAEALGKLAFTDRSGTP